MSALIHLQSISKRHGAQQLFCDLSISIEAGERLGILGPNGVGKSTLLRIIAGETDTDSGSIIKKKDLRVTYATQFAEFVCGKTASVLLEECAESASPFQSEREQRIRNYTSALSIDFLDAMPEVLSGGQRKRLQLAMAFVTEPELLLLDEPSNHLDIESIQSLERILLAAPFAWVLVSHDRWLLENVTSAILEVSPRYPNFTFRSEGGYLDFLGRRTLFMEAEEKRAQRLENTVRNEQEWLRAGVKARTTKAKSRKDRAYDLMESLSLVRARQQTSETQLAFDSSDRKTKRLIELENVALSFGETTLFEEVNAKLCAGDALGILGANGVGKTSLLRLFTGELLPSEGKIERARDLSVSYYRQSDDDILESSILKDLLAGDSDSVVYRGNSLHVASWAKRFGFAFEQLQQPYEKLSGGEKARTRIARLMLRTPDILLLDEPTNDLDIQTLETLESSLLDFPGALVLVTHDRYLINRVCTQFLGIHGNGEVKSYASYEQWEASKLERGEGKGKKSKSTVVSERPKAKRKGLGYREKRELAMMEEMILGLESRQIAVEQEIQSLAFDAEANSRNTLYAELAELQQKISQSYERWAELEASETES